VGEATQQMVDVWKALNVQEEMLNKLGGAFKSAFAAMCASNTFDSIEQCISEGKKFFAAIEPAAALRQQLLGIVGRLEY
jgi:hypothetical protein